MFDRRGGMVFHVLKKFLLMTMLSFLVVVEFFVCSYFWYVLGL